jgi:hypothetical protein
MGRGGARRFRARAGVGVFVWWRVVRIRAILEEKTEKS